MAQETRRLARDLRATVEWQRLLGVDELPLGTAAEIAGAPRPVSPEARGAAVPYTEIAPRMADAGRREALELPLAASASRPGMSAPSVGGDEAPWSAAPNLEALREAIGDCRRCRLCQRRTQIVFGVGHPNARLVFVGEGPGHDEDVKGEPFVGRAGQLLTDIIEKGMRLRRSDVYICNVVKCRPPENRNPEPDEVLACSPFLVRQIEVIRPAVLVTLGKFAAQTLLETKTPITRLRGTWQAYRGIPLMPTFHPAYLLRNPADKKLVWQDIQQVMARLELPT